MALSTSFLPSSFSMPLRPSFLSIWVPSRRGSDMIVRMGGGPRTFPGGVSKWQWKRMQSKKAKQLLKARLLRERQIYEMRKRAELKDAVSQLERPWEAVEKAPNLFSVRADEQVKTLADRFQKPGGFDMWNEKDGPQVFNTPNEGSHSGRFFPKGAVHGSKPRTKEGDETTEHKIEDELRFDDWIARGAGGIRKTTSRRKKQTIDVDHTQGARENAPENSISNKVESTQGVHNIASKNVSKEGGFGRNGSNKWTNTNDLVSTQGVRANASKNIKKEGDLGKSIRPRNSSSRRNNTTDLVSKQGVRPNASTNTRSLKPSEERGIDFGKNVWNRRKNGTGGLKSAGDFERNGKSSNIGNAKFREMRSKLRPTSNLKLEEIDY